MANKARQSVDILLVEDNPGDVELTEDALGRSESGATLRVVSDGEEAMDFLQRRGGHASAPRPDLVVLDLNLPKKDGREVLTDIRSDPELKHLPVIILTSSSADSDIEHSYKLGANCFVTKPTDLKDYRNVVGAIDNFWLNVATLPPK